MVLATASLGSKPEAATVEYVIDGDKILFSTFSHYRKYQNLIINPLVSAVVTDLEKLSTLQLDGRATELKGSEADHAKQKLLEHDPDFANFFDETKTKFFAIIPNWMRIKILGQGAPKLTEIDL